MHPILQNKYVRFAGIGLISLVALFFVLLILNSTFSSSGMMSQNSFGVGESGLMAPSSVDMEYSRDSIMNDKSISSEYYAPRPNPTQEDFTANLESYETTNYSISGRVKKLDELCGLLDNLKTNPQIHFKTINSSTNYCNALFYVKGEEVSGVLSALTAFRGVEVTRDTSSVTRHRAQLQSQTIILQQQLESVERSLIASETQFTEIAEFAKETKDAATLSRTISEKINLVENLTQQKINLTGHLNQLYQQSADLEERLNVVAFSINITRSYPINIDEQSQKWEQAWHDLKNEYTNTLIALTAMFGIFLLRTIQILVYGLVVIVAIRGLWKFIKLLWSKW